jgi:hypothetical protein
MWGATGSLDPDRSSMNSSVQRSFRFLERQAVTFRTEFFSAFNHANLFTDGGVNSFNLLSSNFGNIASTINGNRQIKFWLKYSF